jgi:ATP-dependent Zn protease
MQQTALNTIAIGVFILTISSLVSPLFQISPIIPAAITVVIMGLATVDTFRWENRGATLLLSFLAGQKQKERVLHHEAGHFLAAYFLGIPVIGYTLTAWEGIKQGFLGIGGVVFDFDLTDKKSSVEISLLVDRFSTVLMAGIAAETIVYGNVEGSIDDREKLQKTLNSLGFSAENYQQKERRSQLQATNLIQSNRESYDALVTAMRERKSVEDCYEIVQNSSQLKSI